jgi:hypothetical protein
MKKFLSCIATLLALLASPPLQAKISVSTVFAIGENGSKYYRIPAVTHTADNKIVAICDNRGNSSSDLGSNTAIKLVSKIGTRADDGSISWEGPYELAPNLDTCHGDAAVVFDKKNKQIVCLFAAEYSFNSSVVLYGSAKIYMVKSSDGINWSDPVNITEQIAADVSSWSTGFVASGNMLYANDGSILAVANVRYSLTNTREVVIRSTDGGDTWSVVNKSTYKNAPVTSDANESKIAQFDDNSYIMSIRTDGNQRFSFSDDAANWSSATSADNVLNGDCNGDLIKVNKDGEEYLILSIPNAASRKKVSLFASGDKGATWTKLVQICNGASAYSSLIAFDSDNSIGCFVEEGDDTNGYNLNFYTISEDELDPTSREVLSYDGSLVCNNKGYVTVPKFDAMSVAKGESITVTARVRLDNEITSGLDYGALSTRCYPYHKWSVGDGVGLGQYKGNSGFEFITGHSTTETFGVNVSVDGSSNGWSTNPGSLSNNKYTDKLILGEWTHVALTINTSSGNVNSYVNGESYLTQSAKDKAISMVVDLLIGNRYDISYQSSSPWTPTPTTASIFDGNIDDVRIYKDELSADDIVNDMNSGFPLEGHALIAAYDFSSFENNTFKDISGNEHNGTATTIDEYVFPTINHDLDVIAKQPKNGALHVQRYDDGKRYALKYDEAYQAAYNQDFYIFAEPHPGFELEWIKVNGVEVDNDSYVKSENEMVVTAKFKHVEKDLDLYLVGDETDNEPLSNNKFSYDELNDNYILFYSGDLAGKYFVKEAYNVSSSNKVAARAASARGAVEENPNVESTDNDDLYTFYAADKNTKNENGSVTTLLGVQYPISLTSSDDTTFSVSDEASIDGEHFITDPTIIVDLNENTLEIYGGIATGVENIAVDDNNNNVQIFNLQGVRVPEQNIKPGVYIIRSGNTTSKVHIK